MAEVHGIIYKTTCLINNKIYIGQTVRLNNKYYLGSGTYLKSAIKKYGKENFIREILKECYNQVELDEWEDLLIWEYNSRDKNIGYNIANGSVGEIGENNPCKLPEVRKKLSESLTGIKRSKETRTKMSIAKSGIKFTEEHKYKLSKSHIGCKNHKSLAVCQYDKLGNFIAEYGSIREAEKQTGICHSSIAKCCLCRSSYNSAGGFLWKYKK